MAARAQPGAQLVIDRFCSTRSPVAHPPAAKARYGLTMCSASQRRERARQANLVGTCRWPAQNARPMQGLSCNTKRLTQTRNPSLTSFRTVRMCLSILHSFPVERRCPRTTVAAARPWYLLARSPPAIPQPTSAWPCLDSRQHGFSHHQPRFAQDTSAHADYTRVRLCRFSALSK